MVKDLSDQWRPGTLTAALGENIYEPTVRAIYRPVFVAGARAPEVRGSNRNVLPFFFFDLLTGSLVDRSISGRPGFPPPSSFMCDGKE